jgi:AraC family transcriptional regulator, arabinose operon regulatory protein
MTGSFKLAKLQSPCSPQTHDRRIDSVLGELATLGIPTWRRCQWERLAVQRGISYSRFEHLFRQRTGLSPRRFVKQLCLLEAKRLLEEGSISIKEVMITVGFADPSHFYRDFRALTGLGPKAYRDTHNAV